MSRPAIAYNSKYGSTRRYALALSERLGTPAVELSSFEAASTADPLIVLAPIYATRIRGRKRLLRAIRSAPGRVALVVVGLSPADDPGRGTLAAKLAASSGRAVTTFDLRGDLDPARLSLKDRVIMAALRRALRRTPDTPAAQLLLSNTRIEQVEVADLDPSVAWAAG